MPSKPSRKLATFPNPNPERDYEIVSDGSHGFTLVHYYISPQDQLRQLEQEGFEPLSCLDLDGRTLAAGETDEDGRIRELADVEAGTYRLVFYPPSPFFRRVELELELGEGHHHVPLLVSPYACATYRGS